MPDLVQRLQRMYQMLSGHQEFWWLIGLLVVLFVVRQFAAFSRRPRRKQQQPSPLDFDVQVIPAPAANDADLRLRVYHIPVKLGFLAIAPLGREVAIPMPAHIPDLLDQALPGLGNVVRHGNSEVRIWPFQLSESGFTHNFGRHVKLPKDGVEASRWCLIAGRITAANRPYMLGLAACAVEPNNLNVVAVESDHHWLDVLRISGS